MDRCGLAPQIKSFTGYDQAAKYIARIFYRMHHEQNTPWNEMCATYRHNWMGERLHHFFEQKNIPNQWPSNAKESPFFSQLKEATT